MSGDCLFCRIAAGEQEAEVVARGNRWVAFRDINPQAPTHVLVVPHAHVASLDDLEEEHAGLGGELLLAAQEVAEEEGVSGAYRVVVNTGAPVGQSIFHLHLHVLGGRSMGWPPG